jgi:hypothetical protein
MARKRQRDTSDEKEQKEPKQQNRMRILPIEVLFGMVQMAAAHIWSALTANERAAAALASKTLFRHSGLPSNKLRYPYNPQAFNGRQTLIHKKVADTVVHNGVGREVTLQPILAHIPPFLSLLDVSLVCHCEDEKGLWHDMRFLHNVTSITIVGHRFNYTYCVRPGSLPNLQTVCLRIPHMNHDMLEQELRVFPGITEVDMRNSGIIFNFRCLADIPNLNTLNLSGTCLFSTGMRQLNGCEGLRVLNISNCLALDRSNRYKFMRRLTKLDASNTAINDETFLWVVRYKKPTGVDDADVVTPLILDDRRNELKTPTPSANVDMVDNDSGSCPLVELELRGCKNITNKALVYFSRMPSLTYLDISHTRITEVAAREYQLAHTGVHVIRNNSPCAIVETDDDDDDDDDDE